MRAWKAFGSLDLALVLIERRQWVDGRLPPARRRVSEVVKWLNVTHRTVGSDALRGPVSNGCLEVLALCVGWRREKGRWRRRRRPGRQPRKQRKAQTKKEEEGDGATRRKKRAQAKAKADAEADARAKPSQAKAGGRAEANADARVAAVRRGQHLSSSSSSPSLRWSSRPTCCGLERRRFGKGLR